MTKFGNAQKNNEDALRLKIIQQQTQQIQGEREALHAKKAGVDAAWHLSAIAAFGYGITQIGKLGQKIVEGFTGAAKPLGETIGLDSLCSTFSSIAGPAALLFGLYYFINDQNK